MDAVDDLVVDLVVRDVAPPGEDVGLVEDVLRSARARAGRASRCGRCTSSPSSSVSPAAIAACMPVGVDRAHATRRDPRGRSRPTPLLVPSPPITSTNDTAGGGHRRGLGGTPARRRLRQATRRRARRDRRARGARAHRAGRAPRRRAPRRRAGRSCSRTRRWTSSASPCRPSCTRRSRSPRWSAGCTCSPRSRSRAPSRRPRRWSPPRTPAGRVLDVAFNHRQRGDIQTLKRVIDAGRLGRIYYAKAWWMRRTGIPQLGSWFTNAEQAGGGPLLDIGDPRARLRAVPARAAVGDRPSARRPTTCWARPGSARARHRTKTGVGGGALRRRGSRVGVHAARRRRDAAGRGELGRAPAGRRRVRDHAVRHRGRRRPAGRRHGADRDAEGVHRRGGRGGGDAAEPAGRAAGTTRSSSASSSRCATAARRRRGRGGARARGRRVLPLGARAARDHVSLDRADAAFRRPDVDQQVGLARR